MSDIEKYTEALLRAERERRKKQEEIRRRVEAGELPRYQPTLAADPDKEHCHYKSIYISDDRCSFDTACGHLVVNRGYPMLGSSFCGCGRKIVCDEEYIKAYEKAHPGHKWIVN